MMLVGILLVLSITNRRFNRFMRDIFGYGICEVPVKFLLYKIGYGTIQFSKYVARLLVQHLELTASYLLAFLVLFFNKLYELLVLKNLYISTK